MTCYQGHTSLSKLVPYVKALMTSIKERLCPVQAGCFWGERMAGRQLKILPLRRAQETQQTWRLGRSPHTTLLFSVAAWPHAL